MPITEFSDKWTGKTHSKDEKLIFLKTGESNPDHWTKLFDIIGKLFKIFGFIVCWLVDFPKKNATACYNFGLVMTFANSAYYSNSKLTRLKDCLVFAIG